MQYNKDDVQRVVDYKRKNVTDKSIILLLYKESGIKYTVEDLNRMVDQYQEENGSDNGRLYDLASEIVFNPRKRKKIKWTAIAIAVLFVAAMLLLGFFVSWTPVIITGIVLVSLILIVVIAFIVIFKTGLAEKILDKFDK